MEPPAPWCAPLLTGAQMRAIDRYGIEEQGIPGIDLMERAGAGVARAAEEMAAGGAVVVVCGKGNNGGDGFVAARLLREAGLEVKVFTTHPLAEYSGDAAVALARLGAEGVVEEALHGERRAEFEEALGGAAVVVDGLLGTGFSGAPRGAVAEAIEIVEKAGRPVVAIDLPSGVDGSTGAVAGAALTAKRTVTFHLPKVGHYVAPGKWRAGTVEVVEIGLPADGYAHLPSTEPAVGLIQREVVAALPRRGPHSHKFTSGQVVVLGGSADLAGAVALTVRGALRGGAGYVIACVPAAIRERVAVLSGPEAMSRALPEDGAGGLVPAAAAEVAALLERGGAVAVGNGAGRTGPTQELIRTVVRESQTPLVLDADGLNAFAGRLGELAGRPGPTVLTPHAGELERLLGWERGRVGAARLEAARTAASASRSVVVLKGDDTIVAAPDGRVAINDGRAPALATAGSGDLLAGVIAAQLAAGADPFLAAAAGVYLHAAAGRLAARRRAAEGVLPTDVAAALPRARWLADGEQGKGRGRWRGRRR